MQNGRVTYYLICDSGVGYEDVDRTEVVFGLLDAGADGGFGEDVAGEGEEVGRGGEGGDGAEVVGCYFAALAWGLLAP